MVARPAPRPAKKTVKKASAKKTTPAKTRPADLNKDGKVTPRERQRYTVKRTPPAVRKRATTAARQGGYTDANFDFIPDKDKLSRQELAAQYQSAVGVVYSVPELKGLFEQGINEGWTPDRMQAAVQNSNWFRGNNEYARTAWAREATGGADWLASLDNARQAVLGAARQAGADVSPQEAEALAKRYIYEGWGENGRQGFLMEALSQEISYLPDERGVSRMVGEAGNLADTLRSSAYANGVSYTDNWYLSAAKSVAAGLTSADDWDRDIRENAASLWPVYADKIRAGVNVYDLASPYINTMASEFEMSPNMVTLNDPYVREALTGIDEQGNPTPMGLWDFQKKLRKDPRWMNTSKAQNEVTGVAGRIMQMFGVMGG